MLLRAIAVQLHQAAKAALARVLVYRARRDAGVVHLIHRHHRRHRRRRRHLKIISVERQMVIAKQEISNLSKDVLILKSPLISNISLKKGIH